MEIADFKKFIDEGHNKVIATMKDGSKMTLRLFLSSTNDVAYFGKGKRRYGHSLWYIKDEIVSAVPVGKKKITTPFLQGLDNLNKFKKAFTKAHPNLWKDLQDGYAKFNATEFESFINNNPELMDKLASRWDKEEKFDKNNGMHFWYALQEFAHGNDFRLIFENRYKTTTIGSNKPDRYAYNNRSGDYDACVNNIKRHLDNKEKFIYSWRSGYDVTVQGYPCEDGSYHATLSLEYRGCGNGHYYLLINENTAVFAEDD